MRLVCLITGFLTLIHLSSYSQQLFINEVSQGTGSKEYVELVVAGNPTCITPVPCMDLRGVVLDDNNGYFAAGSGKGIAAGAVRFANIPFWSCIPQGTLVLIYSNSDINPAIPANDASMTDGNCRLVIPINSNLFEAQSISTSSSITTYPASGDWIAGAGNWSQVSMNNSDDSFLITPNSGTTIPTHGVSWGNNGNNSMIYFSGSASNKVFYFANSTNNNPSLQSNWLSGAVGVNETPGVANNAANDAWIGGMNPQCGIAPSIQLALTASPTGCGATCTGSATVAISGGNAPYIISWSNGATTPGISGLCVGIYTVTVTDDTGCSLSDQVSVTSSGISISIQTTAMSESCVGLCDGIVSSTISGGSAPYNYTWSNGETTAAISALCPAQYSVIVTDNNGCSGTSSSTVNAGLSIPNAIITSSGPFTTTQAAVQLQASPNGGTWTADCGSCISNGGDFNPQQVIAGNYEICYTSINGTCTDTDCITIVVNEGCIPQVVTNIIVECPETSIEINGTIVSIPGIYSESFTGQNGCDSTYTVSFSWYDILPVNLHYTKCIGDSIDVKGNWYFESEIVTEETIDAHGCITTNTYTIDFEECNIPDYNVFIPNTFTPNNDNVNDLFEIILTGGALETGIIMNRWGNVIYEFSSSNLIWNGDTNHGIQVEDGVYNYVLKIRKFNGVYENFYGFITVIK